MKQKTIEAIRDDLCDEIVKKYVNDWVLEQKYGFVNHTTFMMSRDFIPGFKTGFDASTKHWQGVVEGLVKACEFYTNEKNWIIPAGSGNAADMLSATCKIQDDSGELARAALSEYRSKVGGDE